MTSIRLEDGSYYDLFETYTKAQIAEVLDVYSRASAKTIKALKDSEEENNDIYEAGYESGYEDCKLEAAQAVKDMLFIK